MYCSHCGKKVESEELLFCPDCGSRIVTLKIGGRTVAASATMPERKEFNDELVDEPIDYSELSPEVVLSDLKRTSKKHFVLVICAILVGLLAIYQIMPLISDTKLSFAKEHIDEITIYYENLWNRAAEIKLQEGAPPEEPISVPDDEVWIHWFQKIELAEVDLFHLRENLTEEERKELDAYYFEKIGQPYEYEIISN